MQQKVTATIVGSGPAAGDLQAEARRLGLDAHVTFTGAMSARKAFGLGRIMVVPSLAESFPYVVLEAAAAGLPLISTSVGGIPGNRRRDRYGSHYRPPIPARLPPPSPAPRASLSTRQSARDV